MVSGPILIDIESPLAVAAGRAVAITYSLSTNGVLRHVRSEMWGDRPFEYLHGAGNLIPGLERALEGRVPGDFVRVSIPPADAYGERDRSLQQRVPASVFGGLAGLEAGMRLESVDEDSGRVETLLVTDIDEEAEEVVLDGNHPLAGMTLDFEVTVVAVREATDEERQRGYLAPPGATSDVHGPGGAYHRPNRGPGDLSRSAH